MDRQPPGYEDVALGLLVGVAVVAGVLWVGGQVSAWSSGHRLPHGEPLAGLVALAHLGDPSAAWHSSVGSPETYWACTAATIAVAGFVAFAGWRLWRSDVGGDRRASPVRAEGLAPRSEVRRAAGARALVARSKTLRPSLPRPRPTDVGYHLGTSRGVGCWASVEDSMLLLGPPRSGKGRNVVIPMILDAPGAVVTTSTRPDNLAITLAQRASFGPVAVFDPQRLARSSSRLSALRWSLVRGCESPQMAIIRAEALVSESNRSGVENGTFWRQQALTATRCLLHAAALGDRSPSDLYRWSHSAPGAKEAVSILTSHPGTTPGWERALDAIIASDQHTRDSIWAMVANAFSPLADPAVLGAVSPESGREFDPVAFLALRGTLYLLGTASGASATATLVAALIEDVIDAAKRLAAGSPGQRLGSPGRARARRSRQLSAPLSALARERGGRIGHHDPRSAPVALPGARPLGTRGGRSDLGLGDRQDRPRRLSQRG